MKQLVFKFILLFAGLSILVGTIIYANNNKPSAAKIVTTSFVAYDYARAITGNASEIKLLLKPGTETHNYDPTPQDIKAIIDADFFIYNGGESDEWVQNVLKDNNISASKTIKMMDYVELKREDGGDDEYDEHIWTSIPNAMRIINGMRDQFNAKWPSKFDQYTENANKYTSRLEQINKDIRDVVANAKRKELVFADRFPFRYFVDEYGLSYVAAFPGCSDQTEASSSTIAMLIDKIKTDQIPVVLKIELTSDALAKNISNETGAKILTLSAAHNISQEDFDAGRSYADIMADNVNILKEALN